MDDSKEEVTYRTALEMINHTLLALTKHLSICICLHVFVHSHHKIPHSWWYHWVLLSNIDKYLVRLRNTYWKSVLAIMTFIESCNYLNSIERTWWVCSHPRSPSRSLMKMDLLTQSSMEIQIGSVRFGVFCANEFSILNKLRCTLWMPSNCYVSLHLNNCTAHRFYSIIYWHQFVPIQRITTAG